MSEYAPSVPGLYELVTVESTDSSRAYAERLAAAGADEGTLVWVKSQTEGIGRNGQYWMSGHRNLHCSIILRPNEQIDSCCQLSLLACICTALAMSRQAEPMQEVRYRWPNDVLLNRGKVAGVSLSGKVSGLRVDWLVVALNVNVNDQPYSKGLEAASMREEGFRTHDRCALLEAYSREFLSWINRWSDEGVTPVIKEWLFKGHRIFDPVTLKLGNLLLCGTFEGLGSDGRIELATESGPETVQLVEFFATDFVDDHPV